MSSLPVSLPFLIALSIITATGYAAATVGMKLAAGGSFAIAIAIMAAGFVAAAVCEIILMRQVEVALIYVFVIGIETLMVLTFAFWIGETLSVAQLSGAALVVGGLALSLH